MNMNILLILFIITVLIGIRYLKEGTWNGDYLAIGNTRAVSGVFVLMVFLAHLSSYTGIGSGDRAYYYFRAAFSQLIVAPFLFYSGYGVVQSVKNMGMAYVYRIPYRRIFRVWYHFAIAVCFYWALLKLYGYRINPVKIPLVFIGWHSIGNSNWFIFDVLVFYLISFVSFLVFRKKVKIGAWCVLLLSILFGVFLYVIRPEQPQFYNLILAYPFGSLVGCYREEIENCVQKSRKAYGITLAVSVAVFIILVYFRHAMVVYELHGLVFLWILLLLTMKFKVGNQFLDFLGAHIFEIYIYQRIPMILLSRYGIIRYPLWYGLACFACTLVFAIVMKFAEDKLDHVLGIRSMSS